MNKVIVLAVGAMLMSLPASAQNSDNSDDRGSSYGRRQSDLEDLLRGIGSGRMSDSGGATRGAGFLLRMGDATLAVRCDPRDSMRSCVDAATMLLDRAHAAMPAGGGSGGSGGPGSPGSPTPPATR